MKTVKQTREEWLHKAIVCLNDELFKPQGIKLPEKIRISVGFPAGGRRGKGVHRIGECWAPAASADNHAEIFIHPEIADPVEVMAIVTHELVHAAGHWDHKAGFKKAATALGLAGKMTATTAGPKLTATLKAIAKKLPVYPHGALIQDGESTAPKKQGTRLIKLECPACGYIARTTQKWLAVGVPTCVCGTLMEAPDAESEEATDED